MWEAGASVYQGLLVFSTQSESHTCWLARTKGCSCAQPGHGHNYDATRLG